MTRFITYGNRAIRIDGIVSFYVTGQQLVIEYANTQATITFGSVEAAIYEYNQLLILLE